MSNRDEFRSPVKSAVALRAGYCCSFKGCGRLTVGPSDESPLATASVGVAAHIHAAASGQGARRYLSSMTSEERSHIDNAIWLCATHATLIDRDDVTFNADALRKMKEDHERDITARLASGEPNIAETFDLIALGSEIVATGDIVGSKGTEWTIRLHHFVAGDIGVLIRMSESFGTLPRDEQFILANSLGDGRELDGPPSWRREDGALTVTVNVKPHFPRTSARDLGTGLKLIDGDLALVNGDIAVVSGLDALPQKIQLCLWHQRNSSIFAQRFGSRIGEYFSLFGHSPWFEQLTKLEMIRLASILARQGHPNRRTRQYARCSFRRALRVRLGGFDERDQPIRTGERVIHRPIACSEGLLSFHSTRSPKSFLLWCRRRRFFLCRARPPRQCGILQVSA
jgi:hypothetical protein